MNSSPVAPITALGWTLFGVAGVVMLRNLTSLAVMAAGLMILSAFAVRSLKIPWRALQFSAPFVVPLIFVHGVLNPGFQPAHPIVAFLAWRPEGAIFAVEISMRIVVFTVIAVAWMSVDGDRLFREGVNAGLPLGLVVLIAVTVSSLRTIRRRIESVFVAQQARGVPSGPGLFSRIRAMPTVVIPVVVSSITEGSARGQVLTSRGLGSSPLVLTHPPVSSTAYEWVVGLLAGPLLALCVFMP